MIQKQEAQRRFYRHEFNLTTRRFHLEEAAAYLKLSPETILRQAAQGNLPGRKIEDTWRFLKAAIDDWLRLQDSRTLLLQQVGALSENESLAALRADIYQTRGRPEISPF